MYDSERIGAGTPCRSIHTTCTVRIQRHAAAVNLSRRSIINRYIHRCSGRLRKRESECVAHGVLRYGQGGYGLAGAGPLVTDTRNFSSADAPARSVAVTVMLADPFALGVRVRMSSATDTATTASLLLLAV